MTPRLYIRPEQLQHGFADNGGQLAPDSEQCRYLIQVLRMHVDDSVQLFDGAGNRYSAQIKSIDRRKIVLSGLTAATAQAPSEISITLFQGVTTGDKMDWIVEKCTELGVARIVPVLCHRGTSKFSAERSQKKHAHWQRISIAACMQSGRDNLPTIEQPGSLADALAAIAKPGNENVSGRATRHAMLAPDAETPLPRWCQQLADEDPPIQHLSLLVGPESGLSDDEGLAASKAGFDTISLGPRVLRTETAGIVAASIVQSIIGDLR